MSENPATKNKSFETFRTVGLAIDPIHVGTGGARLGRVDNTIVRDPVTRVPKIPGSSLAGVQRAYAAMAYEDERDASTRSTPYYPHCAGQGQSSAKEHCGEAICRVCSVFGRASFAGLAAFSDAHVVLFPVATREGPTWVTSPSAMRVLDISVAAGDDVVLREGTQPSALNLGWLLLPATPLVGKALQEVKKLQGFSIPDVIRSAVVVVSDKLFGHIVNSNLEVRTSVAIDPSTGAAEDGALFTYEALPRGTVLAWDVTCRDPRHFGRNGTAANTGIQPVHDVVKRAHPFLEALGIGGMGTRGMGRLRVLSPVDAAQPLQTSEAGVSR